MFDFVLTSIKSVRVGWGWGCLPAPIHCHYVCRCQRVNVGWDVTLKLCTVFTAIILCLFKYWRAFQELVHFRYWDGDGWMINWCIRRTEEKGVDFKWELTHIESWDKKDHVWIFHQSPASSPHLPTFHPKPCVGNSHKLSNFAHQVLDKKYDSSKTV